MPDDVVLLGVDGGATNVHVQHVIRDRRATRDRDAEPVYQCGHASVRRTYPTATAFTPLDTDTQRAAYRADRIRLSPAEDAQAANVVATIVAAVADVAHQAGDGKICIGIGMPGLKTPDGTGIAVCNNGPRIPNLVGRLETGLRNAGIEVTPPITRIGSDADYAGIGEQYAAGGRFRDVDHAYYIGGGTGLADAMKLAGRLVPFDHARTWIAKAWQFPSERGPTFERLASARGLNDQYAARCGRATRNIDPATHYPERNTAAPDGRARAAVETAAATLAELVFERIDTVYRGRTALPHRGDAYAKLRTAHPYRGIVLERIVIGQHIGRIYADHAHNPYFRDAFDTHLARYITDTADDTICTRCLDRHRLRDGLVHASTLPAGAALGAAVAADLPRGTRPATDT